MSITCTVGTVCVLAQYHYGYENIVRTLRTCPSTLGTGVGYPRFKGTRRDRPTLQTGYPPYVRCFLQISKKACLSLQDKSSLKKFLMQKSRVAIGEFMEQRKRVARKRFTITVTVFFLQLDCEWTPNRSSKRRRASYN